jgi:subtilisin family serine protease
VRRISIGGRRTLATIMATGVVASVLTLSTANSIAGAAEIAEPAASDNTLGAHDEKLLADAEAKGEALVTLIVATDAGQADAVAEGMKSLGAQVTNKVDRVNYLRVSIPTGQVHRAAKLPGVSAVDLNESVPLPDPQPDTFRFPGHSSGVPFGTPPGAGTAADNPYLPTAETGAVAFKKLHPTWDGRGVTIGILDSGIDLDNPWLKTTSTGERKVTDWFTATDPLIDGDLTWRAMRTTVAATPTFVAFGATWTAPTSGSFRVNRFNEAITAAGEPGGDVNRDGDTTDLFGVLYNMDTHDIWVDTNQDKVFSSDELMRPYKENFQIGHFGTDNPATDVREQMPFVVEFREDVSLEPAGLPGVADFVNIGIIEAQHGTHVAGITAAVDILGNGNLDGAAPGAKLVSGRACSWGGGCTSAALMDGMTDLVVNRGVNVINMSIGGLPALNDGNNARALLYNTLIHDFGVQMFISAGNDGPGTNTIGDPSTATDVVSVGATVTKETWLANYGSEVRTKDALFNFSSRGPREDGGFKPNITAPGSAISTTPLWQPGGPVAEAGYALPPGLSMLNGTSMAAPQATGAAALLLSAAKATGKSATPAELRRAIYSTADFNSDVPAAAQGNGEFDVNGAWGLLAIGVPLRSYTVDAPVCTPISQFLATPDHGTGIYNRCAADAGGQKPGQSKSYTVKITRTSGPTWAIAHVINWVGNDGTFDSQRLVLLPLNKAVSVTVKAKPSNAGVHSALMKIDDLTTPLVNDFEVLNTVVASNVLAGPAFAFSASSTVQRNAFKSYFVTVPVGTPALQVNLSGLADGSQTRFIAINPYGVEVESTSSLNCYSNRPPGADCDPASRAYTNPLAGVWEFEVESRRTSPLLDNPFTLSTTLQGVAVNPAVVDLPSVTAGVPTPLIWSLTNLFGPVTVKGTGGPLGSALRDRKTIADQETQFFTVDVPAGASKLTVTIGNPSDAGADLDLFVLLGTDVIGQSADGDAEESVTLDNPAATTYTIRVDGYAVPAGTTQYDYLDVFYSPALGSVDVPGTLIPLGAGGTGTISGSVTALGVPAAGRQLFGDLTVVTEAGAVVGHGSVAIGSVT